MGDAVAEGAVRAREQCVLVFYVQCADDAAHAMGDAVGEGAMRAREQCVLVFYVNARRCSARDG